MLVKSYHRNNKPVGCAKKVDILKAYDSNEWDFVLAAMLSFFFFFLYQSLPYYYFFKKRLSYYPKYSIAVNRALMGHFEGKEGLIQEDMTLCNGNSSFYKEVGFGR